MLHSLYYTLALTHSCFHCPHLVHSDSYCTLSCNTLARTVSLVSPHHYLSFALTVSLAMSGITMNIPGSYGAGHTDNLCALAASAAFVRILECVMHVRITIHFWQHPTQVSNQWLTDCLGNWLADCSLTV